MRRDEPGTSEPACSSLPNLPVDDWGKLPGLRRQRRCYRPAGPDAAPRTHAQLRAAQLWPTRIGSSADAQGQKPGR